MNQSATRSKPVVIAFASGVALTFLGAILMGQGASQPVKSEAQYFVTADGEEGAHLWVREGAALRVVAHGACKECSEKGHDHDHHDDHDHAKPAK